MRAMSFTNFMINFILFILEISSWQKVWFDLYTLRNTYLEPDFIW